LKFNVICFFRKLDTLVAGEMPKESMGVVKEKKLVDDSGRVF
jgi:hypothetical protein